MGQITSNIGLITGINITDTIDKLIAIEQKPRDLVAARNKDDQNEQVAVKDLAARLLSLEFTANKLADGTLFDKTSVTSGSTALSVTSTGTPAVGDYQFTPLQPAQAEQVIASGLPSGDTLLGAGQLSFRFGGFLDTGARLDDINGGNGFDRGLIRITDRAGHTADIDLRFARTVDDVLAAINKNTTISVHAEVHGDNIRLIDTTGQTTSTLKVQEVNQGTTAASLGLADINVAADSADGKDIVQLYGSLSLNNLNGGAGVRLDNATADLEIHFRDNSGPLSIDLNPPAAEGQTAQAPRTLGDLLAALNSADPTRLKAEIGPDGDRIVLTDLTADAGGSFRVENVNGSHAADDLGLTGDIPSALQGDGSVIAGRRLLAGLRNSLLSQLNGGAGLGKLGLLSITDRTGAQATVDLSAAETTDDIIDAINASGLKIKARVNDARDGIQLDDTSGVTANNLVVANGDATTGTAAKLNLAADQASNSVRGGNLKLQVVNANTTLASLNGGAGVALGSFTVFDTTGHGSTLKIDATHKTIGDVIQAINGLTLKVHAEINQAGDGIALVDTGNGSGKVRVIDGANSTAAGLHLKGESTLVDVAGVQKQVLDGSTTYNLTIEATDTAADLITKFNALKSGVTASSVNDGSSNKPFRLVFSGQRSGDAAQFVFDTSAAGFSVSETIHAQDARLLTGSIDGFANGIIASSATGTFTDVLPGASIKVNSASAAPVAVSVATVDRDVVGTIQAIVDTYNSIQSKLAEYTKYDTTTNARGILQADTGVQRIQNELSSLFSGRFAGAGSVRTLGALGIQLGADGTLSFDSAAFRDKLASDPKAVRDFFTTKNSGFVDKLKTLLEQSAGDQSLLANRNLALERRIELNQSRIDFYNARLDASRQAWLLKFNNLELAISKIKTNQSILDQIQYIAPLGTTSTTG
jgi:flagellar hook-associated protein 2